VAVSVSDQTDLVVDYYKQWMFSGTTKGIPMLSKSSFEGPAQRNYWLKNKGPRKFLQYERQRVGINLGWTDDAEPSTGVKVSRWFVTRKDDADGPIRYGDSVALGYGRSPSFIHYKERDFGINLDWSAAPVFEWKLLGGTIGQPVNTGQYLAVYNGKAGECLVFFNRTAGGDIGWPDSKTWGDQVGDLIAEAARNHGRKALNKLLGRD
jgi:hypothetical protein